MGGCSSRSTSAVETADPILVDDLDFFFGTTEGGDLPIALPVLHQTSRRGRRRREARLRDDVRMAEIIALQQSLAAMEDFFQSLLGAQTLILGEAMDPNSAGTGGPPPASREFCRELPRIRCKPGTLCGICGEEVTEATQIPCSHVFHSETCIMPWLERHCSCPVCRYEMKTDDETYEVGRIERMSTRKLPPKEEMDAVRSSQNLYENMRTEQDYDADESEQEKDESIPPLFSFPRTSAVSHYDADESSLETVDLVLNKRSAEDST